MDSTFLKGLSMLEALAHSEKPRGVTELARQLELTKSNAHRLLKALVSRGFARNDAETGKYALTLKVWELGALVLSRIDVKQISTPYLQALADKTDESVHLSLLVDTLVIYIDKIESAQPVRAYSQIGKSAPAYCVATGKALLAFQGEDLITRVGETLEKFTPRTVENIDELRKDLARVRHLGYAINRGEWREDVCGVGAPIRDSSRAVVAAVGISGPASRMKPGIMRDHAAEVMNAAAQISKALGYSEGAIARWRTA